ncbi:unnamed protein product [Calicophoron daubneyi]|uniref:Cilia- and flagella-associated protein 206 n=1 Tax=Calicophoron daubneyi TaxID=300641 RepID=A0AAV2TUI0_CALDB
MPREQAETVITRIIREIIQECLAKGEEVSETLVAYIVKAVVLDPESDFLPDKPLTKHDVQKLVKMCVDRLLDRESPSLDTMKMQVFFELNHLERNEFLEEHHRVMEQMLEAVMLEAIEVRAKTREELEDVYRKIIAAVLMRSGLGAPTNVEVVRETTAALQSVFPQTDVGTYVTSTYNEKRSQLFELTSIVTGIRLFNKDCCKGGAGIDDLPCLLRQGIPMAVDTLREELDRAKCLAACYTSLFLKLAAYDPSPGALSSVNAAVRVAQEDGITLDLLRSAVVNARQYESFLTILEEEMSRMIGIIDKLNEKFKNCLKELRDLISDRAAVPSAQVYPEFIKLAGVWRSFQDEMVLLSVMTTTLNSIQSYFVGRRLKWSREKLLHLISDSEIVYDEKIKQYGPLPESDRGKFTWVYPNTMSAALKLGMEFKGFCAWSIIRHQGLLVRSDLSMGLMLLPPENKLYAFSSPEAAMDFVAAADHFLNAIPDVVRRLPELIQFLKLGYVFSKGIPSQASAHLVERPLGRVEAGMQTEVHPIESYIDKNYEWNEWELRKKALKLANLRKKATSSVQTILSNWRRDNATQVYLLKDSTSSTKEDGYTQVPRPSVFYHGLRGCGGADKAVGAENATTKNSSWCVVYRETNETTVDLTIPVEQQLLGSLEKGKVTWL